MNNKSIDDENDYESIFDDKHESLQQLFIFNAQRSLTNRRNSQFISSIDEYSFIYLFIYLFFK